MREGAIFGRQPQMPGTLGSCALRYYCPCDDWSHFRNMNWNSDDDWCSNPDAHFLAQNFWKSHTTTPKWSIPSLLPILKIKKEMMALDCMCSCVIMGGWPRPGATECNLDRERINSKKRVKLRLVPPKKSPYSELHYSPQLSWPPQVQVRIVP